MRSLFPVSADARSPADWRAGGSPRRGDQLVTTIASGDPVTAPRPVRGGLFYTQVKLSPRPSTVRFGLDAARTGPAYRLSSRSHTEWTWRSAHDPGGKLPGYWACSYPADPSAPPPRRCAVEPMMTLLYHVHRLALNGTARPGRQVMDIAAGHLQSARASRITGVSVQVSADAGATWRPASVTRRSRNTFRAVFAAARGAYMTLRVRATDAAGGSITETITRPGPASRQPRSGTVAPPGQAKQPGPQHLAAQQAGALRHITRCGRAAARCPAPTENDRALRRHEARFRCSSRAALVTGFHPGLLSESIRLPGPNALGVVPARKASAAGPC
jgi:hypothetical protein